MPLFLYSLDYMQASGVEVPEDTQKPAEGKRQAQQNGFVDVGADMARVDEPIMEMLETDNDLETLLGLTKVMAACKHCKHHMASLASSYLHPLYS